MAAHRYWRLLILDNGTGDSVVAVDELDLRVSSAGSRLSVAGNGTASASSTYPGVYSAAGAFDGIDFTVNPSANAWLCNSTPAFPHWLQWDFGAGNAQDINYCRLKNVSVGANAAANSVRKAILQFSDDAQSWTGHIFIYNHPNTTGTAVAYEADGNGVRATLHFHAPGFELALPAFSTQTERSEAIDLEFGGDGIITGDTKIDDEPTDVPVSRRVVLLKEPGAVAIRETWSAKGTGTFSFSGINRSRGYKYTVVTYDHTNSYRAVIADRLTPDRMT